MTIAVLAALVGVGLGVGASVSRCQPDQPRAQAAAVIDAGVPDTGPLTWQFDGLDGAETLPIANR